ncbi:gliding motility-associated C-terminal domain-containing protein [bacterium]
MKNVRKLLIIFIFVCMSIITAKNTVFAAFSSVSITTFTCSVYLADIKPVINHTTISTIEMLGNDFDVTATVKENNTLVTSEVKYKIGADGTWKTKNMTQSGPVNGIFTIQYTIPASEITQECIIYYYIEVNDGTFVVIGDKSGGDKLYSNEGILTGNTADPYTVTVTNTKTETISSSGGTIKLIDGNEGDGETSVIFPASTVPDGTSITLTQKNIGDPDVNAGQRDMLSTRPVAVYSFGPSMRFTKAVTVTLLYLDTDNDGEADKWDEAGAETKDERYLRAFYWDGFDWRLMGGSLDADKNILTFKTTHFSIYAVFPVKLTADMYRPKERIITPAYRDGMNDYAIFDGLNGTYTEVKIYDVLGRLIRTIDDIPYEWDGTDEYGNFVENGVYIYQFKAQVDTSEKLISGMIAVAK